MSVVSGKFFYLMYRIMAMQGKRKFYVWLLTHWILTATILLFRKLLEERYSVRVSSNTSVNEEWELIKDMNLGNKNIFHLKRWKPEQNTLTSTGKCFSSIQPFLYLKQHLKMLISEYSQLNEVIYIYIYTSHRSSQSS